MLVFLLFSFLFVSAAENQDSNNSEVVEKPEKEILQQLISEFQELKERVRALETDRDIDRKIIQSLERTVAAQSDRITALQTPVEEEAVVSTLVSLQPNNTTNHTKLQYGKRGSNRHLTNAAQTTKRITTGQPVAFTAYLNANADHLGAHQNIVFDKTLTNLDNAYNVHHGVFTAPLSGTYVLTSTVLASWNREVWCDIVVNGNAKAHVYARGTDGRHDQGSQTIVIHLNQGDDVSVQNRAVDDAIYGNLYTTFSGFLLFEEDNTAIIG